MKSSVDINIPGLYGFRGLQKGISNAMKIAHLANELAEITKQATLVANVQSKLVQSMAPISRASSKYQSSIGRLQNSIKSVLGGVSKAELAVQFASRFANDSSDDGLSELGFTFSKFENVRNRYKLQTLYQPTLAQKLPASPLQGISQFATNPLKLWSPFFPLGNNDLNDSPSIFDDPYIQELQDKIFDIAYEVFVAMGYQHEMVALIKSEFKRMCRALTIVKPRRIYWRSYPIFVVLMDYIDLTHTRKKDEELAHSLFSSGPPKGHNSFKNELKKRNNKRLRAA